MPETSRSSDYKFRDFSVENLAFKHNTADVGAYLYWYRGQYLIHHPNVKKVYSAVEKGLNLVEVATITDHKDTRMLMRYTHLRAEDLVGRLG